MKRPLWRISVEISPEAEEAVTELMQNVADVPCSIYSDFETRATIAHIFLPQGRGNAQSLTKAIKEGLKKIAACGLDIGSGKISVARVPNENWAESWKRHFKPLVVDRTLLIKPSWSCRKARKGQASVVIDPGLSFGTGQHPTTSFCLGQVASFRQRTHKPSVLDIGTGSGILAIAAAKLGYRPVDAFDFDPDAVQVAKKNADRNRAKINLSVRDATKLPRRPKKKYSLICANLISNLLVEIKEQIRAHVEDRGLLVIAGILTTEFDLVRKEFARMGFAMVEKREENEWTSGSFRVVS